MSLCQFSSVFDCCIPQSAKRERRGYQNNLECVLQWSRICLLPKNYYYFLCDTREKNQPLSLLHLQGPIFDSITRLNNKFNYRNLPFFNLLTGWCPWNNASTKHFKQSISYGKKCVMWNGWVRYFFLLCLICVLKIVQHSKLL